MVDYLAIAISHGLLLLMGLRLLLRNDLDDDRAAPDPRLAPVMRPKSRPVAGTVPALRVSTEAQQGKDG